MARYADACNLFPTPDLARKLEVLRAHCEAEGRDYDEITKTCYFIFDVGEKGEKAAEVVDQLGRLAGMGFQAAIGAVANVWQVTPLEVIASDVIPAVRNILVSRTKRGACGADRESAAGFGGPPGRALASGGGAVNAVGVSVLDGGGIAVLAASG